ncbi:MAG: endonuclease/exonuclease/phosphatase family protein [Bacteroidales bacterium]|nr:endonuclease/exonuclease/phosphatase family protein [Bacteroidales bacterium]
MAYTVMFYNLENLYDTVDDPGAADDQFTPLGDRRWTKDKYNRKLSNLSEIFSAAASAHGGFPVVAGVSEVENLKVLQDLVSQKRMAGAHYKCLHFESNDIRGVEVGMLYRPDKFTLMGCEPLKLVLRSGREYIGRDILAAWGSLDGEMFAFYVCHFLSRRGGVASSAGFRRAGAETARDHAAALREQYPDIKVVIMGDMNDNPSDESLAVLLKARKSPYAVPPGEYYNPFWLLADEGRGTSIHNHHWVLYDNIIVSHNMLPAWPSLKGLRIIRLDKTHYGEIFRRNFMMRKGSPRRSYYGNTFDNGYSDHLPVLIKLDKR